MKAKTTFSHGRRMTRSCLCIARPRSIVSLDTHRTVRARVLPSSHDSPSHAPSLPLLLPVASSACRALPFLRAPCCPNLASTKILRPCYDLSRPLTNPHALFILWLFSCILATPFALIVYCLLVSFSPLQIGECFAGYRTLHLVYP